MDDPREEYIPLVSISREWFEDYIEREVPDSIWNMVLENLKEQTNRFLDDALVDIVSDINDGQYE
jgi:hypothetical protein